MKCKCAEESHLHFGYCNLEITFEDSTPINDYKEERKYGKNDRGEQIVIGYETIDYDKERCCDDCYNKIKKEELSKLSKYMLIGQKIDKEIEKHPLGAGFIQKDVKVSKGCEICGEHVEAPKRADEINICDKCYDKYP